MRQTKAILFKYSSVQTLFLENIHNTYKFSRNAWVREGMFSKELPLKKIQQIVTVGLEIFLTRTYTKVNITHFNNPIPAMRATYSVLLQPDFTKKVATNGGAIPPTINMNEY